MATYATVDPQGLSTLQELIQLNLDSQSGYNDAANATNDAGLALLFRSIAVERGKQADELRQLVNSYGESPQPSPTVEASVHRPWLDIRSALGGGAYALLEEAERGEVHIQDAYEKAVNSRACMSLQEVLNEQYQAVKAAHDRVRDLREKTK